MTPKNVADYLTKNEKSLEANARARAQGILRKVKIDPNDKNVDAF